MACSKDEFKPTAEQRKDYTHATLTRAYEVIKTYKGEAMPLGPFLKEQLADRKSLYPDSYDSDDDSYDSDDSDDDSDDSDDDSDIIRKGWTYEGDPIIDIEEELKQFRMTIDKALDLIMRITRNSEITLKEYVSDLDKGNAFRPSSESSSSESSSSEEDEVTCYYGDPPCNSEFNNDPYDVPGPEPEPEPEPESEEHIEL